MNQNFFEFAYKAIESQEEITIELIKDTIYNTKIIKTMKKVALRNIFLSQI